METTQYGLLMYRKGRYLKLAATVAGASLLIYALNDPGAGESYGGTPLGYALGIASAAVMLLLFWYGIQKRCPPQFRDRRGVQGRDRRNRRGGELRKQDRRLLHANQTMRHGQTLQGWLSAHIWLGVALPVLATLHTGFEFGTNVHTLAYALMMLVVASGLFGLYAYLNYPRRLVTCLRDETLADLMMQIGELDENARLSALELSDEVNQQVAQSRTGTRIGGNFWQQLSGAQRDCPTAAAVDYLHALGQEYAQDQQPRHLRELYVLMLRKQKLVERARHAIRLKAGLDAWLYLHAPVSAGALAALFAHVLSILFLW